MFARGSPAVFRVLALTRAGFGNELRLKIRRYALMYHSTHRPSGLALGLSGELYLSDDQR